jgi:hypothetical protein
MKRVCGPTAPITPLSGSSGFGSAAAAFLDADHLTGPLVAEDSSTKRLSMGKYESVGKAGSRSTSSMQLSADAAAGLVGGAEGIVLEGTLAKVGKTFAQFVERHYAIRSNFLYAFKSKDDVQPNRVHFLEGCFIEVRLCLVWGCGLGRFEQFNHEAVNLSVP